uniref:Uncharacterized protein n=1 Tax=Sipha flava TaxID=143950 RepID=A0A2S2QE60_9HEMI
MMSIFCDGSLKFYTTRSNYLILLIIILYKFIFIQKMPLSIIHIKSIKLWQLDYNTEKKKIMQHIFLIHIFVHMNADYCIVFNVLFIIGCLLVIIFVIGLNG